jgi:hypothetical protein
MLIKRSAIVAALLAVLVSVPTGMANAAATSAAPPAATSAPAAPVKTSSRLLQDPTDPTDEQCRVVPAAQSDPGWFPDRYTQCRHRVMETTVLDGNNRPVGVINADLVMIGYANNGARQVDYIVYVTNITGGAEGLDLEAVHIGLWFACFPYITPCPAPASGKRDDTVAGWRASDFFATTLSSPEVAGGGDQIEKDEFDLMLEVTTPGQPFQSGPPGSIAVSKVRYDSASYVGRARGSVFTDYVLRLEVSLSDPNENESALHIKQAVDFPIFTLPSWVGKSVPGEEEDGEPLTRMYNPTLNSANRTNSENLCRQYYGSWDSSIVNCDEYPFASTYEGSKTGPDMLYNGLQRFSVRLIDRNDNQYVGNTLLETNFYRALRVLDGDKFYVSIVN